MIWKNRSKIILGISVAALLVVLKTGKAIPSFSGGIFTTLVNGTTVNNNIYQQKNEVYLNGGPQNENATGLPDGIYYFQVTNPSGTVLLSTDNAVCRQLQVVGNVVAGAVGPCPHSNGITNPNTGSTAVQLAPFDSTPNPGGEYKVWLIAQTSDTSIDSSDSRVINFKPRDAKTDNFKVNETNGGGGGEALNTISGMKFYDANVDGIKDESEPGIQSWKIWIYGGSGSFTPYETTTDVNGNYSFLDLDDGTYNVCEVIPELQPVWIPTTPTAIMDIYVPPDAEDQNFGNVCLGPGGGHTLGFWSNKNGEKQMNDNGGPGQELEYLNWLNLADMNGFAPNFQSYAAFRSWLLKANAKNMAYMLSAQLAAMVLNVEAEFVNGDSLVYAPGCGNTGLNVDFITINDLMTKTNDALAEDGFTPAGDEPQRSNQECLKNALDAANNNDNFVQAEPCQVNYSGYELSCVPEE